MRGMRVRVAPKITLKLYSVSLTSTLTFQALWAVFAAELLLKSCGTDHARLSRAVFALAQVRLLRTGGFSTPPSKRARELPPPAGPRLPRTWRPRED